MKRASIKLLCSLRKAGGIYSRLAWLSPCSLFKCYQDYLVNQLKCVMFLIIGRCVTRVSFKICYFWTDSRLNTTAVPHTCPTSQRWRGWSVLEGFWLRKRSSDSVGQARRRASIITRPNRHNRARSHHPHAPNRQTLQNG